MGTLGSHDTKSVDDGGARTASQKRLEAAGLVLPASAPRIDVSKLFPDAPPASDNPITKRFRKRTEP